MKMVHFIVGNCDRDSSKTICLGACFTKVHVEALILRVGENDEMRVHGNAVVETVPVCVGDSRQLIESCKSITSPFAHSIKPTDFFLGGFGATGGGSPRTMAGSAR